MVTDLEISSFFAPSRLRANQINASISALLENIWFARSREGAKGAKLCG
jgi:hypothetical protein